MNKRTMLKCPNCGGTSKIGQYRMPTGAIWCDNCGFRVEHKEVDKSFFVEVEETEYEVLLEEDN